MNGPANSPLDLIHDFANGPLVWIAFIGFLAGTTYKLATMAKLAQREKIVFPTMSAKHGGKSILHWIIPFANRNTRLRPVFTIVSFAFHLCLLITPLFVMGHAVLWQQSRFAIRWWSLPPGLVDFMTLVVIFGCLFFAVRRLTAPEVRNVSDWTDYALLLLVVSPFLTGFLAHMQWLPPKIMVTLHIICGALWLLAIPFTRLSHMIWFLFTRAFMGSEFGKVRNARDW